ncbi:uncharacterized protein PSANT_04219 [Moesziomyces antarcticus]|nr:uncharacterized protein PSANT_04219 [Moesziomyces antarcticus]
MIRDELLGNDSVASDTEPLSDSSTSKSEGETQSRTTKTMDSSFSEADLEDRLSCSGIAHSLRHIALAFDEKSRELDSLRAIQQRHDEELAILQDKLKTAEQEQTARTLELQLSNSSREDVEREIDALKQRLEEKDALLFVSDRVLHRLFNMIRVIKTQVDEAESLSPAVRTSDEEAESDMETAEDSDEDEVSKIEAQVPTLKSQAEEEIDKIVRDIAERYGKTTLDEEA